MSTQENGGAAFPVPSAVFDHVEHGELIGMTLRDWFAGLAMQAMNTNPYYDQTTYQKIAENAFMQADFMIAERQKE